MNNLKNIILLISLARIAWIDGKSKRITNKSLGTLLAVRLFFLLIEATEQTKSLKLLMTEVWFGFLIGGGLFFFCYCLGKQAMGAGDVKLMAVLGSYLGGEQILRAAFFAVVYELAYILWNREKKSSFAPFALAGVLTVLIWKNELP
jgi:Flp pilus assembly protein protease CpaA